MQLQCNYHFHLPCILLEMCLLILCCTCMRTKHTCASCLCLSGDKMAATASTKPIRPASTSLKATLWQHFVFHEVKWRIDKTYTVCKVCGTQLKYFSSTTYLRNHIAWYHLDLGEAEADYQIHCKFYCVGFKTILSCGERGLCRTMVFTLEPRYKIPSRRYFTDTDISTLYSETKTEVLDTLMKACW